MSTNQDMQVRAINAISPNIGGGRTAALAVGDGGLYPAEADLSPEKKVNKQMQPGQHDRDRAYGVSGIHVPLKGKIGCKSRFGGGRDNSRIDRPCEPRETDGYHPIAAMF